MTRALPATFLACAALAAATAAAAAAPRFDGPTITHPTVVPGFELRDQAGRLVRLSAERGRVVVLTFLYTHCPDQCPLTAEHVNDALTLLGPRRRRDVRVLAVSVDPARDTRRAVRAFVRVHGLLSEFRYLTGPPRTLAAVWHAYGVHSARELGDRVDHTLFILLVDREGRGRVLDDATATPMSLAHDLRLLLLHR